MRLKASRSFVGLWRRLPPTTARLLSEASRDGRPVRALAALLVVTVLGTGAYVAGAAMTGEPSDQTAGAAQPAASYDGEWSDPTAGTPTSDDGTPDGRSTDPSASATGPSEAPTPTTTATPTPRPKLSSAAGSPSTSAESPAANPVTNPLTSPSTSPSQTASPQDTAPPRTSLSEGVAAPDAALFTFSANEPATFSCSLDGAAYTSCGSPLRYVDLAAGWHTLAVRATDAAGNTDPTPAATRWHSNQGHPAD
jgi:hypothetical protein